MFQPTFESFVQHYTCPDWFRDAKFGIFLHWGVNSVPGFNGHYARFNDHVFFQGEADTTGPLAGVPYDTVDPAYADLYGRRTPDRKRLGPGFGQEWEDRHMDLIDKYLPDLLYFDGPLPYDEHGLQVGAHFYNRNRENHGGALEAVLTLKHGFPDGAAIHDIERGQSSGLRDLPWQTDTTLNSGWFYLGDGKRVIKVHGGEAAMGEGLSDLLLTGPMVIQNLCDIVSKNGNLLLNAGQRADGSLPEHLLHELEVIGAWLEVHGEAIYGTRPWKIFGEGPTRVGDGYASEPTTPFTTDDIRFTTKGRDFYVIVMGEPKGDVVIPTLGTRSPQEPGPVSAIRLIGSDAPVTWEQTASALTITAPSELPSAHATVFKVQGVLR